MRLRHRTVTLDWHNEYRYVRRVSIADDVARPLTRSGALRFVFWVSLAYLVVAAIEFTGSITQLVSNLAHRATGVQWTWDPSFPVPQPTGGQFYGGPYLVPGSTATFTEMTGTVAGLPIAALLSRTAGDVTLILTSAGIAACLVVLTNRMAAGVPFGRASHTALLWLAGIVVVGFETASVLHGIASSLFRQVMMGAPQAPDGVFVSSSDVSMFTLWPVYVGVAVLALAAVFRVGAAYRDDSDGLI